MKKIYNLNAIRITLTYLIFGILWIILSDKMVELFVSNGHSITTAQTYKGWAFIIVTSLLLFFLLDKVFRILQNEIERHKSTIDLLENTENRFRLIFENSGEAIFLTKQDGSIEAANPEACKIFNRTLEEIFKIGRDGIVDVNDPRLLPALQERKRTGRFKGELNFIRKDGTIFPGEITSTVFLDLENQERTTIVIRDISERQLAEDALRKSKKEFQTYFDSSSVGLSVTAPDKTWIEVNQRLCEILGYTKEELIGLTWENLSYPEDNAENLNLFQKAMDREIDSYELDKRFIRKDGSIVYVTLSVVCQRNDDGSVHHFLSSYNDITERKQIEQALQKSEERYRLISNVASDYMFSSSVSDNGTLKLNWVAGSFEKITGYTFEEYIAHGGWRTSLHPDDLELDEKDMTELNNNKKVVSELRTLGKNGNTIWVRVYAHPVWDNKEEKLIGIYGAVQDITKHKLSEEELQAKTEELNNYFTYALDLFCIADTDGYFRRLNKQWETTLGYSLSELEGKRFFDFVHPDDLKVTINRISELQAQKEVSSSVNRYHKKDGTYIWIEWRSYSDGKLIYAAARDITIRKVAEDKLRESEERFRDLVENINEVFYISDAQGKIEYCSSNSLKELGYYSLQDILGKSYLRIVAPIDRRKVADHYLEETKKGAADTVLEFRVIRKDGTIVWAEQITHIVRDHSGNVIGYRNVARDITKRKNAEDALRDSEHKLRLLLESSEDIILMQDLDGKYIYYNGSEAYGIKAEEVIGKTPYDLHKPKYAELLIKRIKQISETGHALFLEDKIEWQNDIIWFSNGMFPVKNKEGKIISVLTISRNINNHKQMEENLRESEERFHSMFVKHNAVMLLIDPDNGKIIDANISASKYYGYSVTQLTKMKLNDLNVIPPDELRTELDEAAKESRIYSNFPHKLSTGEIRLVEVFTTPIKLKDGIVLFSIIHDITKRRQAEQEVLESKEKLRALTGRLERVKEEERIYLSRELHDHLGQNLTGLKMDIAYLAKKVQTGTSIEPKDFLSKTSGMIVLIDELINNVRRISAELRPNVLDYLGLIPAIEWQMEELKKRTTMDWQIKSNVTKVDLGNQINSSIFRIIQEAVTNIIRHSGATKVLVSIEEEKDIIKFEILDDGIGIKEDDISNARSLGILGMKERTFQFNGRLHLENAPKGGTLLTLIVPKPEK